MLDAMISIPGPLFLLLYGVYLFGGLVVVKRLFMPAKASGTESPRPNQLTPFDVAFLQGRHRRLAHTLLFDLWSRGYLEIRPRASGPPGFHRTPRPDPDEDPLLPAARRMADDATVYDVERLLEASAALHPTYAKLARLELLYPEVTTGTRLRLLAALALLLAPGVVKAALGVARDRPVGLLFVMLGFGCVGCLLVWSLVRERARCPSPHAERFIHTMSVHNRWMRDRAFERYNTAEHVALQVALFGAASLAGREAHRDFLAAVPAYPWSGTGAGGGASGGDGGAGDSGSDSGGGDSGGGGCGGCGGGGGD